MFKKLLKLSVLGAVGVAALGYFVFGDHATSYLSTVTGSVRENVRGKIPVEFEIKRAEKLVRAIEPELNTCKRDVACAEVELENLERDVDRLEDDVAKAEKKLKAGGAVVCADARGAIPARLVSQNLANRRFELDLERTFDVYRNNVAILRGKKALIERQGKAVAAARARLDAVRSEQARLTDMIGMLKTQKAQLDALAAGSRRFDLDDSNLSKAKQVLTEVKKRLDVAQRMIEDETFFAGGSDEHSRPDRDIGKEIREYFDGPASTDLPIVVESSSTGGPKAAAR
jgi:septal ring factor EnvC (AmiA/AmiB activator)